jgi:hypothetical protein
MLSTKGTLTDGQKARILMELNQRDEDAPPQTSEARQAFVAEMEEAEKAPAKPQGNGSAGFDDDLPF